MKATWERLENDRAKFELEVPVEQVSEAVDRAYRRAVKKVNIPGFRRGRAPRVILERYVGKGALMQEALEQVVPEAFDQAVEQSGLDPIDEPKVDIVKFEEGQPLVFTAEVPVKPEVKLGEYRESELKPEPVQISDEEVEENLKSLAERQAKLVTAAGPLEKGHFAVIDFEGRIGGEAFEGGTAQGYTLEIGSGKFIPGFEEGLVGAELGAVREVPVRFPAEYQAENLAGKEAVFRVTVREIKRKEVPPIDDELARSLGNFQSLQELRNDLANTLREAAQEAAKRAFREKLIQAAVNSSEVHVPELLVDRRIHRMIHDLEDRLRAQGLKLEAFLANSGKTHQDLHAEFHDAALKSVKTDLVLEAIAKAENLAPTDEEVREQVEETARLYGAQAGTARQLLSRTENLARVRQGLRLEKATNYLEATASARNGRESQ